MQLAVGTATGIGAYQLGLSAALRAIGVDVAELRAPRLDPWRFDRRVLWDQVLLPLAAMRGGAQILHATSGTMPLLRRTPVVVTVHDLAWLRVQRHTRAYARAYFGAFMNGRYRTAARIVADSHFSRAELLELAAVDPARVDVVYPGVDPAFGALVRTPDAQPLLLAVGTVERRKNLLCAIEALARVPGARLVSIGPPTPYLEACRIRARELGVETRVEFRGYVARSEMFALYRRASVALVPSLYEGFGYAAADALCAGVPVIAARTSSLVEVVGDDGILLEPHDAGAWAAAIEQTLATPRNVEPARARTLKRFAWQTAARQLRDIYTELTQ